MIDTQLQVAPAVAGTRKLMVTNLPHTMTDEKFSELFVTCGKTIRAKIMRNRNTSYSFGYGLIEYATVGECEKAMDKLNTYPIGLKSLVLTFIKQAERNVKLNVTGIGPDSSEKKLRLMFGEYGQLVTVKLMRDLASKGNIVGFVMYSVKEEADAAMRCLQGYTDGKGMNLVIRLAADAAENEMMTSGGEFSFAGQQGGMPLMAINTFMDGGTGKAMVPGRRLGMNRYNPMQRPMMGGRGGPMQGGVMQRGGGPRQGGPMRGNMQPGGPMRGGMQPGGPIRGGMQPGGPMRGGMQPEGPMRGGMQPGGPMRGGMQPGGPMRGGMQPEGPMRGGMQPGGPLPRGGSPMRGGMPQGGPMTRGGMRPGGPVPRGGGPMRGSMQPESTMQRGGGPIQRGRGRGGSMDGGQSILGSGQSQGGATGSRGLPRGGGGQPMMSGKLQGMAGYDGPGLFDGIEKEGRMLPLGPGYAPMQRGRGAPLPMRGGGRGRGVAAPLPMRGGLGAGKEEEGPCLFVYNIGPDATDGDMYQLFARHGRISEVQVAEGKGYAFVHMFDRAQAEVAIQATNGLFYEGSGKKLEVSFKKDKK